MAQTSWADANEGIGVVAQTEQPQPGADPGGVGAFGNPTTILLLVIAAAFLWWNMRRRRVVEERLREQRRQEAMADAEQSARNVAHIMRGGASPEAAAAAASEGLASAAWPPVTGRTAEAAEAGELPNDVHSLMSARAEAAAQAEAAAEDEALRAAKAAEGAADAEARHMAAAVAVVAETRADSAEAQPGRAATSEPHLAGQERAADDALRAAPRDLDNKVEAPLGAIEGDDTAICPPSFPVKGSLSAGVYHLPGQAPYPSAVAEFCFASAEAAEAAGLQRAEAEGVRPAT